MKITFSREEIEALATEIKKQLLPAIMQEIRTQQKLPPLLTRKQFMELVGIGDTKCAELFNRADFPVCREFGHPRVHTEKLFEWIEANTNCVKTNATEWNYPYKAI